MAEGNFVFTDVPVSASVRSAQRATPDEIVKIAKDIWEDVRSSGVAAADNAGNDELLSRLQEKYKDFMESFPLVLRWMVQTRQFHPEALRKYLLKHAATDLGTREAFLRLQAEYLVILYRETHAHPDEAHVKRYRESIAAQLLEEDEAVVEIEKQVEREFAQRAAEVDQARRAQLCRVLLARQAPAPAPAEKTAPAPAPAEKTVQAPASGGAAAKQD